MKWFINGNVKRPTYFIITCSFQHELENKWMRQLPEGYPGLRQTSKMEDFPTIISR